ncbi:hypothetical protein GIS00_15800 [Nakamurella sp. YIM 132087]|uniref:Peptidase n=1 Tax=Nakamurella alba TaxID=2665158 RepID=A0A7K1FML6_9ACTN|nr:hypothetical protein [Nakamurella alba]MTD15402.1 hypothetical protein [Nakamurella alba]
MQQPTRQQHLTQDHEAPTVNTISPIPSRRRDAVRRRTAFGAALGAVSLALVVGCSSTVAGTAAAPAALAMAGSNTSTAASAPSTTGGASTSGPATPTTEQTGPVDLTTGATTVAPPATTLGQTDGPTRPTDVEPATDIEIIGDKGTATDQLAKDSLSDVIAYWDSVSQEVFGEPLPPLKGGVYAVDPDDPNSEIPACLDTPEDARNNAFFCGADDSISYDAKYLERIAEDYSDLDVAFTFAHEFGHALQFRFLDWSGARSIVLETQADCLAGAWAKAVTDGLAPHFEFSAENLDRVLGDYVWEMGDPAGTDPEHARAHGSVFDRISATQDGYLGGPTVCRDDFNDERIFTAEQFTATSASTDGMGNLNLDQTIDGTKSILDKFWTERFTQDSGFVTPEVSEGAKGDPSCADDHLVSYCDAAGSIDLNPMDSVADIHKTYGDYGLGSAMILAYTEYLQTKFGSSTDMTERICTLGAVTADLYNKGNLSPGDFDEAVKVLVFADKDNALVETGDGTAWDRLDAFRVGIYEGLSSCNLH